jgi:uncharacterized protein (TIGR00369 family)
MDGRRIFLQRWAPVNEKDLRTRMEELSRGLNVIEEAKLFMSFVPFNRFLGLDVEEIAEGRCRMSAKFREEFIGDPLRRALHGGVLSAIIDTCGGATVWSSCERGDRLSTVDLRVDYLRPGLPLDIAVEGRLLRLGNHVGVAEMIAYHPGKKHEPVATGTGVYNVRRSPDRETKDDAEGRST